MLSCSTRLTEASLGPNQASTDMTAYVRAADAIRDAFACSVVIVHHCGINDSRPRGHTSLTGAVDAQLAVTRDGENVFVKVEFMKDGQEGETIASRFEAVEVGADEDGEPITSGVMVESEAKRAKTTKKAEQPQQGCQGSADSYSGGSGRSRGTGANLKPHPSTRSSRQPEAVEGRRLRPRHLRVGHP